MSERRLWREHSGHGVDCVQELEVAPCGRGRLCTFSDANDSIDAAVEVLFGEREARGRLPIRISDAYPFGFGLIGKKQQS